MFKYSSRVNVSDMFKSMKNFDVCAKDCREKSAVDKAIESLCNEQRLFAEDIMRCDIKEEIATEILKSCPSIENAFKQSKEDELSKFSSMLNLDKDPDVISLLNIDVNYVDVCLDISDVSRVDAIFKEKKGRLERRIREVTSSDDSTIEQLEKCMGDRDEIIVSQYRMQKNILELCRKIRQLEVDRNMITDEICFSPETTDGSIVKFDYKTEIQKAVKMQRKVDKIRNMAMLKGCQLLMCREGNNRIMIQNGELKEDLKRLIVIIRDLHSEYKRIQSDLCDSDNVSMKENPDELPSDGMDFWVKPKDPTKKSKKKEVRIVKPKVSKPSDIPTREPRIKKEPKDNKEDFKENNSARWNDGWKENLDDIEILEENDVAHPPNRVEIKQYDANIPGTTPDQTPDKEKKRHNSGKNQSERRETAPEKLIKDPFFRGPILGRKAKEENEILEKDEKKTIEIKDFDENLQSDSSDEFPWDPKFDFKRRGDGTESSKNKKHFEENEKAVQKDEQAKSDNKGNKQKYLGKKPQEDDFTKFFEPIQREEHSTQLAGPPNGGTEDCYEIVKIEQYDASTCDYATVKSSNQERKEVGTGIIDRRQFRTMLQPTIAENQSSGSDTEEDEDEISLDGNILDPKFRSDKKPPPGGAAGCTGQKDANHSRSYKNNRENSVGNTEEQCHQNESNGRNRDKSSRGLSGNHQVESLLRRDDSSARRNQREMMFNLTEPIKFSTIQQPDKISSKKIIFDSKVSQVNLNLNTKGPSYGLLNENHTAATWRKIHQAMNNQEAVFEYPKLNFREFGETKDAHNWQKIFRKYQEAYTALVKANHDYEDKYEATVKDLAKYKEDYDILCKVNIGAENIVDQIRDLKKRNSTLEEILRNTDELRKDEHEDRNLHKDNEKTNTNRSCISTPCSHMSNPLLNQKISQLEAKIECLSNHNDVILKRYEESQNKLTECERNLKLISEKMLEPPKNLVVPVIPGKKGSYKDWANYSKYSTERLNEHQVALDRSNFVLKILQEEKDTLRTVNDQQNWVSKSSSGSIKCIETEQNGASPQSHTSLLAQRTGEQANARKIREDKTRRFTEENRNSNNKLEITGKSVKCYQNQVEKLNNTRDGTGRLASFSTDNTKYLIESKDNRNRYRAITDLPCSISGGLSVTNVSKVVGDLSNKTLKHMALPNKQHLPPSYGAHELKLLHIFLEKEICKCIEKLHTKSCSQQIRQELEGIKNKLGWSKRKLNEVLTVSKDAIMDLDALHLRNVCARIIQSGVKSGSSKNSLSLHNFVHHADKKCCQKLIVTKKSEILSAGMKKWNDLEADINLTNLMLEKLRFQKRK